MPHEILWGVRCRRTLTAITLAVVTMGALSACQTKIGQAAAVEGATLSDSDLSSYLKPGTGPYTDQSNQRVVPKLLVLTTWIRTELLNAAIAEHGGAATTPELNGARAAIEATNGTEQQAEQSYTKYGYETKFGDLLFDETVRLVVLVERLAKGASATQALQALQQNSQVNQAIGGAIAKFTKKVELSPRYGTWDPAKVKVSDTKSGAPDFVKLGG
jgi:hypothetical protein